MRTREGIKLDLHQCSRSVSHRTHTSCTFSSAGRTHTQKKKQRTESNEDSQEDCMTIRWDHSAICTCHGGVVHVKRLLKGRERNPDGRSPALVSSNILSEPENPENGISFCESSADPIEVDRAAMNVVSAPRSPRSRVGYMYKNSR